MAASAWLKGNRFMLLKAKAQCTSAGCSKSLLSLLLDLRKEEREAVLSSSEKILAPGDWIFMKVRIFPEISAV